MIQSYYNVYSEILQYPFNIFVIFYASSILNSLPAGRVFDSFKYKKSI